MPGHGTNAYRVTRYELDLDYKLSSNRLSGRAVLHAVTQYATAALVLDLTGLRATKIQLSGRRVRKYSQRAEQLVIVPEAALPAGEDFTLDIRYEGNPVPAPRVLGRGGLGGTHRRRPGGRPAERRSLLVPLQRPPG